MTQTADPHLLYLVQRLAEAECVWLNTVRPDGRAHSTPIWHVWHGGRIYCVTKPDAVKVRNIRANPSVVVTHPDPVKAIIVEGRAAVVDGMADTLRAEFLRKYDWDITGDTDYRTVIAVTPDKLLAWNHDDIAQSRWTGVEVGGVGLV